jgi:8-oxo-dGTP diphosphatase
MRRRPSSRLLVIDRHSRVLLFRFVFKHGPLAGQNYWATPGGALEAGESFADAARRELFEETGILRDGLGREVAEREFVLQLHDGEYVMPEERFFLVRVADQSLSRDHWTPIEIEVMTDHRWWSVEELTSRSEAVFPETLAAILASIDLADTSAPS